MLKYMIDTDIAIFTLKERRAAVHKAFNSHSGEIALSSVSWGELIYGAEKSLKTEYNLAVIENFAARLDVLPFEALSATHFGQLRAELARSGQLIGPYDMMIAGHARSLGLILVTNNVREFARVPGLRVENWAQAIDI